MKRLTTAFLLSLSSILFFSCSITPGVPDEVFNSPQVTPSIVEATPPKTELDTPKKKWWSSLFDRNKNHCDETLTTTVTELVPSSKGGYGSVEVVTREVEVPVTCPECITRFTPCEKCCGGVSDRVIKRASAQGWNGNPHIGLIPTMKVLAE